MTKQYKTSEKRRSYYKQWYQKNKESQRARSLRRQAEQTAMFKEWKSSLRCEACGYSKCIEALDFHHINPDDKFESVSILSKRSFRQAKEEAEKCQVLCKNCHAELHASICK